MLSAFLASACLGPACQKFSQKSMPQYIYYIKSLWRELFRICTFLASAFLGSACQKFSGGESVQDIFYIKSMWRELLKN